jgi:hypothetical protein
LLTNGAMTAGPSRGSAGVLTGALTLIHPQAEV